MNYKISIIIPIHNIERYLTQTLESLLNQTIGHENLEIIMVDDCSDDGSIEIINNYANEYENFIAIHLQENSGLPGKPRNVGIERATGDFLIFMDHDDYLSEDACEVFYNKITNENVDIVFSRYNYIFDDGRIEHNPNHFGEISEIKIDSIDENIELLKTAPSIWTKIFRRKFIIDNNIRFPEGMLAEDLSFVVHSFLKANGIVYLNNYFNYNYRIRTSYNDKSTIQIRNKKYLMAMIMGYYDTYNVLEDLSQEKYAPIIFIGHFQYWMNSFLFSDANFSEKTDLLEEIGFLFEKLKEYNLEFDVEYLPLYNYIISKEFEKAILVSDVMAIYKKRESNSYHNYKEKLQKQFKTNKKLRELKNN